MEKLTKEVRQTECRNCVHTAYTGWKKYDDWMGLFLSYSPLQRFHIFREQFSISFRNECVPQTTSIALENTFQYYPMHFNLIEITFAFEWSGDVT